MNRIATIKGNTLIMNGIALLVAVGLYFLVFKGVWNVQTPENRPAMMTLIILLVGMIVLHEGIHGAAALLFVDRRRISLSTKWPVACTSIALPQVIFQ